MTPNYLKLSAEIAKAYVSKNSLSPTDIGKIVRDVHDTLRGLGHPPRVVNLATSPAVPVGRSISHDHIVCLEDGKKFRSLKRHLAVHHALTPEQYRERWNLPRDYPMIPPDYAAVRSQIAKAVVYKTAAPPKLSRGEVRRSPVRDVMQLAMD